LPCERYILSGGCSDQTPSFQLRMYCAEIKNIFDF
jgi:hypothetical protein